MRALPGILFVVLLTVAATVSGARADAAPAPRFAGFTETRGGAGGEVIRVTNLNAEGPGSLRAALETAGKRIIVFEVGGVLDLGESTLIVSQPHVTIAGETAPPPGVTVIRGGMSIRSHDVIVRHLRIRPGDAGNPARSGWEPDGVSTWGADAHDIIIEHCSVAWAVDENLSASGPRLEGPEATSRRVTIRNCIIAEALSRSSHARGEHSKGTLVHDQCREIAIVGNLYAHNRDRNPFFKARTTGVVVNNLIYNPGIRAISNFYVPRQWKDADVKPEPGRLSIVGNVLRHGRNTRRNVPLVWGQGEAFLEDNVATNRAGKPVAIRSPRMTELDEKPVWPDGLTPLPAERVESHILKHAGARPKDRDATDRRIVREVRERKGRIINSQDDREGYPKPAVTRRPLDVPDEGVDAWLTKLAEQVK